MNLRLTLLVLAGLLSFVGVKNAYATTTPTFPLCINAEGTLKVQYDNGTHGIVGRTENYNGSDAVYLTSGNNAMQCFCPENGQGVQTNWWKVSSLSDEEIQIKKNEGWLYVQNGAAWGLDDASYLAKNSDYSCKGTLTSSSNTGGSSSGPSSVLTASTNAITQLASTGNLTIIISLIGFGITSFISGLLLLKIKK